VYYTALYVIADNPDLLSPECFLGSSREEQREALYAALYGINQEPEDPTLELEPVFLARASSLRGVLEDEDPVGEWPEIHGNDLTQASFMQQPIFHDAAPEITFDGIDDFVRAQSGTSTSLGDTNFCLQVWVKVLTKSELPVLVGADDGTTRLFNLIYSNYADRFYWEMPGVGAVVASNGGPATIGQWYLVHAWHDATNNQLGICVNAGTPDVDATTGVPSGVIPLCVGARNWDGQHNYANASFNEVAFFSFIPTADQRTAIYNYGIH
jgi:hypothetical protein